MKSDVRSSADPSLSRSAAGGAIYLVGAQAVRALSMIVTTIVVARVLTPSDFGVIAMWAPILAFVQLFQDLGFSAATIQAKEVRNEQSSTLFWVNIVAALLLAALLIMVSQPVARFYDDPRVGHVTAASAGLVLLGSFAIQHTALLTREMRYRQIATIVVFSALANTTATIVLAYSLANYWALFWGTLIGTFVQVALTWVCSGWRPGPRATWSETRPLFGFGSYVAAFDVLNFLNRNVDSILIGRVWGAAQLGLYERSQKLMLAPLQLINSPLARVTIPVLSRLREEPERYRSAYLFNLRVLLLITVPAAALVATTSEQVILVLLGPMWSQAAPVFFWLALATLYQPLANSTGWLFISSGKARDYAAWALVSNVVILASFVIGLRWGAAGVAEAYVIGGIVRMPFLLYWASRNTPVRAFDMLRLLPSFAIAGVGTWGVATLLKSVFPPLPLLIVGLLLAYLFAIAAQIAAHDGRAFLATLLKMLKSLRSNASALEEEKGISPLARAVSAEGLTYLSTSKLVRLEDALDSVTDVPGDFAEFGVALGGSAILIASRAKSRRFHGFDLFGMIPPPTSHKDDHKSRKRYSDIRSGKSRGLKGGTYYGYRSDLFSEVQANFASHGLSVDGDHIQLHKGLFEETVPNANLAVLAFAHIDCDWYDPVTFCLRSIGPRITQGGAILIDDFHDYGGCRRAVKEFLADHPEFSFEDGPNPILRRAK